MVDKEQSAAAFERVIKFSPTSALRKAAAAYWTARSSGDAVDDKLCENLQKAVQGIPLDYRRPALQCLEAFEASKTAGTDISECFNDLAVCLSDKIIPLTGK